MLTRRHIQKLESVLRHMCADLKNDVYWLQDYLGDPGVIVPSLADVLECKKKAWLMYMDLSALEQEVAGVDTSTEIQ